MSEQTNERDTKMTWIEPAVKVLDFVLARLRFRDASAVPGQFYECVSHCRMRPRILRLGSVPRAGTQQPSLCPAPRNRECSRVRHGLLPDAPDPR
jgi:hypothetical protein